MRESSDVVNRSYTAGQAATATGVAYNQINYWAKTGVLVPSVQKATGSNSCRVYGFGDLVALSAAGQLREAGVALQGLRQAIKHLQGRAYVRSSADAYLVIDCEGAVQEKTRGSLLSALSGKACFVFALGETVEDLKSVAKTLKPPTRGKACLVS